MAFPEYQAHSMSPAHSIRPTDSTRSVQSARSSRATRPITQAQASLSPFVGAITCPVCEAVYAPAQGHESLLHAPVIALESAFMSMCRFCFRCRRPSCPLCWDATNNLCGSCVQELGLPFRQPLSFFDNALPPAVPAPGTSAQSASLTPPLPPVPSSALIRTAEAPLRCVYTGRFEPETAFASSALRVTDPIPATQNIPTSNIVRAQNTLLSANSSKQTAPSPHLSCAGRAARIFERVFVTLLLLILATMIILAVVTSLSVQANDWFVHVLHIDIHALLLTVWNLLRHLLAQ